jgi:hypothetical protein
MKPRRLKPDALDDDVEDEILSGMDGLRRSKREAARTCAPHRPNRNDKALFLIDRRVTASIN